MNNEPAVSDVLKLFIRLRLVPDYINLDDRLKQEGALILNVVESALDICFPRQIQVAGLLNSTYSRIMLFSIEFLRCRM
jgi:hypothetical protein